VTFGFVNNTRVDQLWLVVSAPPEPANALAMSNEELAWIYPDGPKAMPPALVSERWLRPSPQTAAHCVADG
jgi:hypothetical protein